MKEKTMISLKNIVNLNIYAPQKSLTKPQTQTQPAKLNILEYLTVLLTILGRLIKINKITENN